MDIFNLFNSATVLGRDYDLASSGFNQVREIVNPRIIRFGVSAWASDHGRSLSC